jgi:hypothetical protein
MPADTELEALLYLGNPSVDVAEFVSVQAMLDPAVGRRIGFYRKQRGWTRREMANYANVLEADVELAECAPAKTPIFGLMKIVSALKVSFHDLAEEVLVDHAAIGSRQ